MSINTEQIKTEVKALMADTRTWHSQRHLKQLNPNEFKEKMIEKYNYLHTNSSTLFDRCIIGDINMDQFNFMIRMLEKVNNGKDYQEVSKEVGQKLVDVYIKPVLNDIKE